LLVLGGEFFDALVGEFDASLPGLFAGSGARVGRRAGWRGLGIDSVEQVWLGVDPGPGNTGRTR
jgi:hypothetical protein